MPWSAGSIVGNLGLDISGFTGEMLKAQGIAELMPRWVTDFMVSPLLGMADAAKEAGHALVEAIGESANRAFDIALQAEKAGTSIKFFSQWSEVAKDVNLTSDDLGQTFMFLNRSIAELANGEAPKEVAEAFGQIGISQQWASQHLGDTEAIFAAVRQGLRDIHTESERVNAAREILGRGGPRSIPLFQISDDEVKNRMEIARQMGVIEGDESAASARHYHELRVTAQEAWEGIKKSLSEPFQDYFSQHSPAILAGIEQIHANLVNFAQGINIQQVVQDFEALMHVVAETAQGINDLIQGFLQLQSDTSAPGLTDDDKNYLRLHELTGITNPSRQGEALVDEHDAINVDASAAKIKADFAPGSNVSTQQKIADLKETIELRQKILDLDGQMAQLAKDMTGQAPGPDTDLGQDQAIAQQAILAAHRALKALEPSAPAVSTAPPHTAAETPATRPSPPTAEPATPPVFDPEAQTRGAASTAPAVAVPALVEPSYAPPAAPSPNASLEQLEAQRQALSYANNSAVAAEAAVAGTESLDQVIARMKAIMEIQKQVVALDDEIAGIASDRNTPLPKDLIEAFTGDYDSFIQSNQTLAETTKNAAAAAAPAVSNVESPAVIAAAPAAEIQPDLTEHHAPGPAAPAAAAPSAEVQPDLTERHGAALRSQVEELAGHIRDQRGHPQAADSSSSRDHDHAPAERAAAGVAGTSPDLFTAGINELVQGVGHALGSVFQSSSLALAGGAAAAGSGIGSSSSGIGGGGGGGVGPISVTVNVNSVTGGSEAVSRQVGDATRAQLKSALDQHARTAARKAADRIARQSAITGDE
jgi:hypothetical protein